MPLADLDRILALTQFPGQKALETAIGQLWLRAHANDWDTVEFNVRLGTGVELPPGLSEATQRAALLSSQHRADMVLTRGTAAAIVELKERINFSALGQVKGYSSLYLDAHPNTTVLQLFVVGQTVIPGVRPVLEQAGIIVELFG